MADGNVSSKAPKAKSALDLLLESVKDQKPNASDIKKVSEEFKKSMGKRDEILKQLEEHDAKTNQLAINMVKCHGKKHITVNGVRYVPTSRGERVFYKRMSDEHETVEL